MNNDNEREERRGEMYCAAMEREDVREEEDEDIEDREGQGGESEVETEDADDSERSEFSEDNNSTDEEDANENIDDEPLYDGARITLRQSSLSILSFALSHKLSKQCINDLLSLIELHCGENSRSHKSVYKFHKCFSMLGEEHTKRHYYCSMCETPLRSKDSRCITCAGRQEAAYFIEVPIIPQLQGMFKKPGFMKPYNFNIQE